MSRNNSFYETIYDSVGERTQGKREEQGLEGSSCIPVSDMVIEKLRQHVKQLESKLQVAYMEIERLKVQSNPNVVKVENASREASDALGGTNTEPPCYTFYSHAMPITLQQEETRESGSVEMKQKKIGNEGTPNSSRSKSSRYWSCEEHSKFLEGLELYGAKDIKAISNYVGTRSSTQVRTHAQKYYLRLARELLRKQSLEVGKTRGMDKVDDWERSEAEPSGSGSSDFSVDELCYDSLSGMKIPKAAIEIAKQEARRLGSKGEGVIGKKGSWNKSPERDSIGHNSYVNSPVFSEGYSGSNNMDWDDSEIVSRNRATTSKRSRAMEDVSTSCNVRVRHKNSSGTDTLELDELQTSCQSREPIHLQVASNTTASHLTWQEEKDNKGIDLWRDNWVADIAQHSNSYLGQLDYYSKPPPLVSNMLSRVVEGDDPNWWTFQHGRVIASSNHEANTFGSDNVSFEEEQIVSRPRDSHGSEEDDVKKSDKNTNFLESKLTFPFHSESFSSFHGSEVERIDLEQQTFGCIRNAFPKTFSKPLLSASFSSLGELEDTHNLEQAMFGTNSAEEIRE